MPVTPKKGKGEKVFGKSAPQRWQQRWQGKPHLKQDQIEELSPFIEKKCGPHCSWVGRLRCLVTNIPDE